MRWSLRWKGSRVRGHVRKKLNTVLASKLAPARAWELKEAFQHFWKYNSLPRSAFVPANPRKWPCITRLESSPNLNLPTDSAEEAENVNAIGRKRVRTNAYHSSLSPFSVIASGYDLVNR